MQNLQDMYRSKRGSAEDALNHVRDGDMIIVPTGVGEPPTLLHALSAQCRRFTDVQVAQILAMRKYGYFVAQVRGKSAKQRAQALIAIAHPAFRPWLREQANGMCVF